MDIRKNVVEILCNVNSNIQGDADEDLLQNGYIDSFEIVNVVMELEDVFAIEIDPELIIPDNFRTISAIVQLIEEIV